ncbi:LCP family protein [Sinomonas sp. JGH33]|uniref:LCP family protein n=1 Tax=Sinomonas terricola TaxID=3110330 RepID=A0ABU5T9B1_9MICC|nr:LCP family protein [Sinomonas sp. JGH33]MEA5455691.1 LCP family protein [Sinomonas sp. JGH33]
MRHTTDREASAPNEPYHDLYGQLIARDRRRIFRRRRATVLSIALVIVLVLAGGIFALTTYLGIENGIKRSQALDGGAGLDQDANILLMGLDSRLDENGNALSQEEYDALHSGSSDDGGYNSNVLMLLHVPKDGSTATIISIPRDDYVDLAGAPDGVKKGKVKQAYGYAMDQAMRELKASQGSKSDAEIYQQARDAGRKAEIETVQNFLNVKVDHFVEVTMAAFLSVAKAVAPITVCLQEATKDTYSGADFKAGQQQLNAQQAVAFVRQRRDTSGSGVFLTDLDRARRQQAFISSLATQLKQKGTFTDLGKIQGIIGALKDKMAVDQSLNLIDFGLKAKQLTENRTKFVTLPIVDFGWSDTGESINVVDQAAIRAQVSQLLSPQPSTSAAAPPAAPQTTGGTAQQAPAPQAPAQGTGQQGTGQQGPQGAPAPAQPSPSGTGSYDAGDWSSSLFGGGIPCVK